MGRQMQRGDVVWLDLDPACGSEQAGRRPGVVMTRDAINRHSPVVVILPLTTYRGQRLYPSDVLVQAPEGGLSRDSVAMALQIRVADQERLGAPLGRLEPETIRRIEDAILQVLDIDR